ncbi:winged helix DNA-binding domain-containing protein [soil metagenome]
MRLPLLPTFRLTAYIRPAPLFCLASWFPASTLWHIGIRGECGVVVSDLERLRAWSYRRQHLDRSAAGPLAALERVLAVHSTHPPAPLSLLARTAGFDYSEFETLEREKKAVSLPVMRGSVHLLPAGFASAMFAATKAITAQLIKRLGVDPKDGRSFEELREALLPLLARPVEGSKIRETLGITEREFLAIRLMTRSGDVLRISTNPRSDRLMYVATEAWLGVPFKGIDALEGRRWLAGGYFDAFGPARLKDFAWWLGVSQRNARAAVEGVDLVAAGDDLLLPVALEPAYVKTRELDAGSIAIIPKWDCYTMGFAPDGRRRIVDDLHLAQAYTTTETRIGATTGDGHPLILRGGRAVARWSHRFSGKTMSVEVTAFQGESVIREHVEELFQETAILMKCENLKLDC